MPRTKQFDRDKVLKKAMDLFWKQGFHATSIQDLVNHLGINRASMYDTFGGKDQLFQEAFQYYQKENGRFFQNFEKLLAQKSARAVLEEFFALELQSLKKDKESKGCMAVNVTTELSNQSEDIYQLVHSNKERVTELFSQLIQTGQERDEISTQRPPEVIARHLVTFFNGLKVISKIEKDPQRLKEIIDLELEYIFH